MVQRATRILFDASGIGQAPVVHVYLSPDGYKNERYVREHEVRIRQMLINILTYTYTPLLAFSLICT
jgi:hypothetical protein